MCAERALSQNTSKFVIMSKYLYHCSQPEIKEKKKKKRTLQNLLVIYLLQRTKQCGLVYVVTSVISCAIFDVVETIV